jgi:hypothetical protein
LSTTSECSNQLGTGAVGQFGDEVVVLALAQHFEVRVGLVKQDGAAPVGIQVGQQQQRLLQATPRSRNVEQRPACSPIGQAKFAADGIELRNLNLNAEQLLDPAHDLLPVGR